MFTIVSNYNDHLSPTLLLTSKDTATVTIKIPSIQLKKTITIEKHAEFDIPTSFLKQKTKFRRKRTGTFGIEVVSNAPIAVFAVNSRNDSSGGSLILPESFLGMNYFPTKSHSFTEGVSEVAITATKDNTAVQVAYPNSNRKLKVVMLNRFEVLTHLFTPDDVAPVITSSRPVNVQAGRNCAWTAADDLDECDLLGTDVLPAKYLHTTYIVPSIYPTANFSIHIVPRYDNTEVTVFDSEGNLLLSEPNIIDNKRHTFDNVHGVSITANEPIYVSQVLHVSSEEPGDASQTTIPPPQLFTNYYPFLVTSKHDTDSILCITIYSLYDPDAVLLDGKRLTAMDSNVIMLPCSGEFNVQYASVSQGFHTLTHEDPGAKFGAILYSRGANVEYATYLGLEVPSWYVPKMADNRNPESEYVPKIVYN